ncbi:MAG TPA: 2-dehydro-3-deoxygalactonokinase [Devosia sp.]|nr:2-dehydro-3-deoxygalactonokinase [Devosia sp.]
MSEQAKWIAVDWGTSNLRLWGMDGNDRPVFAAESDRGMGKLQREEFAPALLDLVTPKLGASANTLDIVICGMAGARQGWVEAPYVDTPADLAALIGRGVEVSAGTLRGRILPGVAQRRLGAEDVMRGEETQLLGLLRLRPGFEGVAIHPGTHSKWVEIAAGRIIRFQSAMTGELYDVLSKHSVLRHSLAGEINGTETEAGVAAGLDAGLAEPELVTGLIFRTRAAALLSGKGPDWCSGFLSGLLVGAEVAGHKRWLGGSKVPLIGSARLCRLYGAALGRIGIESEAIDATDATLAGLTAAHGMVRT